MQRKLEIPSLQILANVEGYSADWVTSRGTAERQIGSWIFCRDRTCENQRIYFFRVRVKKCLGGFSAIFSSIVAENWRSERTCDCPTLIQHSESSHAASHYEHGTFALSISAIRPSTNDIHQSPCYFLISHHACDDMVYMDWFS
jgi:hypothetical protein